jgi:hypothetical protein
MLYPILLILLSKIAPFIRDPLIQKLSETIDKIHDHNDYPPYHIPSKKQNVSYLTSLTLNSEPPTFLTRGGGGCQGFTTTTTVLSLRYYTRTWLSSRYK